MVIIISVVGAALYISFSVVRNPNNEAANNTEPEAAEDVCCGGPETVNEEVQVKDKNT